MHQRLQRIYSKGGDQRVGVLHHKNASYLFRLFEQECCTKDAARMARTVSGLARELYHPIRVTTPHQILRVALQGKGWELGLLEFPNACFVFDEIHVFEPLLMGLTVATAKWLKSLGAKILFASATIPRFMEKILLDELEIPATNVISPDPSLPGDRGVCNKIRHHIEVRSSSLIEGLPLIISEIADSKETALIVCNHVATSQQAFDIIEEEFRGETVLLHSRFNSRDRARIESIITGKNPPRILVATQAVEVSLDLNYGRGYTEPAPADALGQRLGRINRSGSRPQPARVVVFTEPSNGYLYDEQITRKTVELLSKVGDLTEQELTNIVNEIYGEGYQDQALKDYLRGLGNSTISKFEDEIIAGTYRAWVEDVIEKSDGQIEILPLEGTDEGGHTYSIFERFEQYRKNKSYLQAKELFVPIRIGQWRKLLNEGTIYYKEALREWCTTLRYSEKTGLDLSQQSGNIF
jgi:CRISPR-associated endonuclease/helicase Cas3